MHERLLINGDWVDALSGETFDSTDPSNGKVIARVAKAAAPDVERAVAAARVAFDDGPWPRMKSSERAAMLLDIAHRLRSARKELAELESRDSGSTIRKSMAVDVTGAVETFRVFAELARNIPEEEPLPINPFPGPSQNYVRHEPIGVCGQIVPWNFPLLMAAWKIAPAIAAGNTLVLKPASFTSLTALRLGQICLDAGVPAGVVNIVTGPGDVVGEALATSPYVDKIALTGSTETGRRVMRLASETIKRVTLELGGKSAAIVLADADLDLAIDGVLYGVFFHAGQVCESGTRLFVPDSIYDTFMRRLVERARGIKIGSPMDLSTDMGPLVSPSQVRRVQGYVDSGKREGARLVLGGDQPRDPSLAHGAYYEPTIFEDVDNSMEIAREEIFGPVLAVIRYREVDEAIRWANQSIYGLAGAVWSRDISAATAVANRLRTGTVWINDHHLLDPRYPFGGYKQSGLGREFGREGYLAYTETKHVHIDLAGGRAKHRWFDIVVPQVKGEQKREAVAPAIAGKTVGA